MNSLALTSTCGVLQTAVLRTKHSTAGQTAQYHIQDKFNICSIASSGTTPPAAEDDLSSPLPAFGLAKPALGCTTVGKDVPKNFWYFLQPKSTWGSKKPPGFPKSQKRFDSFCTFGCPKVPDRRPSKGRSYLQTLQSEQERNKHSAVKTTRMSFSRNRRPHVTYANRVRSGAFTPFTTLRETHSNF